MCQRHRTDHRHRHTIAAAAEMVATGSAPLARAISVVARLSMRKSSRWASGRGSAVDVLEAVEGEADALQPLDVGVRQLLLEVKPPQGVALPPLRRPERFFRVASLKGFLNALRNFLNFTFRDRFLGGRITRVFPCRTIWKNMNHFFDNSKDNFVRCFGVFAAS